MKSTDGGAKWQRTGTIKFHDTRALALDPEAPDTLSTPARPTPSFRRRPDGGATRQPLAVPTIKVVPVRALVVDPKDSETVYAAIPRSGVVKTTDGGTTWKAVTDGLTELDVRALAIDPRHASDDLRRHQRQGLLQEHGRGTTLAREQPGLANRRPALDRRSIRRRRRRSTSRPAASACSRAATAAPPGATPPRASRARSSPVLAIDPTARRHDLCRRRRAARSPRPSDAGAH